MDEIGTINDFIQTEAGNNANIIMGIGEDLELGDKISVTVVATGFPAEDQVFTGREEEKVFHRLEEEQPLIQKLSKETPFPVHVKKIKDVEEPQILNPVEPISKSQELKFEEKPEEIKFFLNEEDEKKSKPAIEESWEPQLKKETLQQPLFTEEIAFENPVEEEFIDETEETVEEEFGETIMFTLDDDFEEEITDEKEEQVFSNPGTTVQAEVKQDVKIEIEETEDPLNSPISQSLSQAIEERRARLKQFNYKFKNTLSNKSVDEVESIPAYKRQGIELTERDSNSPSDLVVGKDSNDEIKIRPNNFLHDNVD